MTRLDTNVPALNTSDIRDLGRRAGGRAAMNVEPFFTRHPRNHGRYRW